MGIGTGGSLIWSLVGETINISKKSGFPDFHLKEKCVKAFFFFPFVPWIEVFPISLHET